MCTGEHIIQKTPQIWAGGNSTGLFTNPLTASPLAFTALLPKQMHSRAKSRQLGRLLFNHFSYGCNLTSTLYSTIQRATVNINPRGEGEEEELLEKEAVPEDVQSLSH